MRRVLAVALVCAALAGVAGSWAWAGGRRVTVTSVQCTATAVTNAVGANVNRTDLTLQNVGTLHISVGGPAAGITTIANFRGITLHVNAAITFTNYQGGVDCMTQTGTGSSTLEVLEETQ